jgi:hypothetical protein
MLLQEAAARKIQKLEDPSSNLSASPELQGRTPEAWEGELIGACWYQLWTLRLNLLKNSRQLAPTNCGNLHLNLGMDETYGASPTGIVAPAPPTWAAIPARLHQFLKSTLGDPILKCLLNRFRFGLA